MTQTYSQYKNTLKSWKKTQIINDTLFANFIIKNLQKYVTKEQFGAILNESNEEICNIIANNLSIEVERKFKEEPVASFSNDSWSIGPDEKGIA